MDDYNTIHKGNTGNSNDKDMSNFNTAYREGSQGWKLPSTRNHSPPFSFSTERRHFY